jgi:hypothetical protein
MIISGKWNILRVLIITILKPKITTAKVKARHSGIIKPSTSAALKTERCGLYGLILVDTCSNNLTSA